MSALRFCLGLYSSLNLGLESAPPLTRVKVRSEFSLEPELSAWPIFSLSVQSGVRVSAPFVAKFVSVGT